MITKSVKSLKKYFILTLMFTWLTFYCYYKFTTGRTTFHNEDEVPDHHLQDEDEVPEAKLVAGNEPEVAVVLRHGEVGSP